MTTKHTPSLHASLGASSSDRWMNCAGSIRLSRGVPATTSPYAEDGSVAHELAATCLKGGQDAAVFADRQILGHVVDDDMAEHVQTYLDHCRADWEPGDPVWIEQRFSLEKLGPPEPMFGTGDFVLYKPRQRLLKVKDLKYGQGVAVEAIGNPQLRYYGLGALLELPPELPVVAVECTVVQPRRSHRDGPVRSETISGFDLVEWSGELFDAAVATQAPDAPLVPGEWCRFCPAADFCPALRGYSLTLAAQEFDVIEETAPPMLPPVPEYLDPAQLGRVLDAADVIETWLKACREEAFRRLERGQPVAGWKLVDKRANRKWNDDEDTTVAELKRLGLFSADVWHRQLKSPAQVEKLLAKPRRVELERLYSKVVSGVTLARAIDDRQALLNRACGDFAALES